MPLNAGIFQLYASDVTCHQNKNNGGAVWQYNVPMDVDVNDAGKRTVSF